MASWCVARCVMKCVKQLHTWKAASPRQHWAFSGVPSPTTRPPRLRKVGGLRVVGLGTLCLDWMAGAGRKSWVDWEQILEEMEVVQGRKER
jgi:hypothetical protein